ncbi:hypothetical protein ACI6Q2_08895 [Chitinophagaceae bacterium LWZ2-11]
MRTIKFIAYLFYRYYSTGATKDIPYFSTLCAMVMLFGLHVFQILILVNKNGVLPTNNNRFENFIKIIVYLIPVFLLFTYVIKRSDLQEMNYDEGKIKKGNIVLIVYILASIALLVVLMLIKTGKL